MTASPDGPPPSKARSAARSAKNWFLAAPIRLLIVPYLIGIVWHGLHPLASVLTGDLKRPRQHYIDENSLEPSHFSMLNGAPYDLVQQTKYDPRKYKISIEDNPAAIESLCQGVRDLHNSSENSMVSCHRHSSHRGVSFEVAKILPLSAGVVPVNEAIVLVVPTFAPFSAARIRTPGREFSKEEEVSKSRSQFQASMLQLIRRLSSQRTAPWLAKTVLVVSPVPDKQSSVENTVRGSSTSMCPLLERTVESFLDAYLGRTGPQLQQQQQQQHVHRTSLYNRLPFNYTGALLRNLIVLDLELFESRNQPLPIDGKTEDYEPETSELRILPQGRRGVLPNMDLTFVVRAVYERSSPMLGLQQLHPKHKTRYKLVNMVMHPHRKRIESILKWLEERGLPPHLRDWTYKMLHLLSFERVMAFGPYPPHAPALDRGIDALTIQGSFVSATDEDDFDVDKGNMPRSKLSPQQYALELVQKMEYIVRSLSNLHERLHHSTSLYLLPSPDRFVKHEEYLIPNLLLVIPLIIRVLLTVFRRDDRGKHPFQLDLKAAGHAVAVCTLWTAVFSFFATHKMATLFVGEGPRWVARSVGHTKHVFDLILRVAWPPGREEGWREIKKTHYDVLEAWIGRVSAAHFFVLEWIERQIDAYAPMLEQFVDSHQLLILYTLSLWVLVSFQQRFTALRLGDVTSRRSIQVAACLLAACVHIPMAFGHASLAFASALMWTPLLAFPSQNDAGVTISSSRNILWRPRSLLRCLAKLFIFSVSCPFTFLVPHIFPFHTIYGRYVYTPLHILFSLLLILPEFAV